MVSSKPRVARLRHGDILRKADRLSANDNNNNNKAYFHCDRCTHSQTRLKHIIHW